MITSRNRVSEDVPVSGNLKLRLYLWPLRSIDTKDAFRKIYTNDDIKEKNQHLLNNQTYVSDSLIEIRFGDPEEGAVAKCTDSEDERLSGQHGQLTHHLTRLRHEQANVLLLVDHALIHVQAARQHKMKTHILTERKIRHCYSLTLLFIYFLQYNFSRQELGLLRQDCKAWEGVFFTVSNVPS